MRKSILFFLLATVPFISGCFRVFNILKLNETKESCDFIVHECRSDEDVINNKDCYKVYADVHIFGGWREIGWARGNLIYEENPHYKERTYYLGDIYDLENAKPSYREKAREKIKILRMEAGNNYVRGNHEMDAFQNASFFTKANGILFTHGHHIYWHKDKNKYWESGKRKSFKKGQWKYEFTEEERIMKAVELAKKENCHTLVFGHRHVNKLSIMKVNGITLINARKGCTYLNIP